MPDLLPDGSAWPRVSVVTPSYNQAGFIEETIRSVLLQGYPNLEYIIVDGGSTDGSIEIIKKYERFLARWVSEPDRGQTEAINKGLRWATGDIVAYLNSDDTYLPAAIAESVEFLHEHPETDLMYAYAERIDGSGRVYERVKSPQFELRLLARTCFIRQPTVFFRRSLIDQIGYFDASRNYCMDYEYWLRASAVTKPERLERFTATDRYHAAARAGSQHSLMVRHSLEVLDRAFAMGVLDRSDAQLVRESLMPRLVFLAGLASGSTDGEREEAIERLRTFEPEPTAAELVAIIAAEDAYYDSPYITSRPAVSSAELNADVYQILPSLVDGRVISEAKAERVRKRVQTHAEMRRIIRQHGDIGPLQASVRLGRTCVANPWLLTTRSWWVEVARTTSVGRSALPAYYVLRDVSSRVRRWSPFRAAQRTGTRGGAGS